jgi:hypothetical protein
MLEMRKSSYNVDLPYIDITCRSTGDQIQTSHALHWCDFDGIIYVVNGVDLEENSDAVITELSICNDEKLHCHPLLILITKMDLPYSIPCEEVRDMFRPYLDKRNYHIQACNALTGEGLGVGFKWLLENMQLKRKPLWLDEIGLEEYEGTNFAGPTLK